MPHYAHMPLFTVTTSVDCTANAASFCAYMNACFARKGGDESTHLHGSLVMLNTGDVPSEHDAQSADPCGQAKHKRVLCLLRCHTHVWLFNRSCILSRGPQKSTLIDSLLVCIKSLLGMHYTLHEKTCPRASHYCIFY